MAEAVEDLESAESLLAGRTPCQRVAIETGRWVQTPIRSPARAPTPHPRHPPLFFAIQR